ncbi:cell division suppressor protein YneA [Thermaerobacillus caldiproteolyticus]|uniref:LysM repeat protein n=1 Tax=Thermaerobacillus caldiproteolyticus TaxID=247480 RepID=A0A7W0BZV7_9BACL|nr:cell division suppressor protein YneA [Anoxybacillus caldiproteolyticus]MBA2876443.1 LysM repeat protein [Anoxybacillus caldiproteolyticus]QPA32164.1 cell division suppressor protein YneA [Anoxybacillus caldiproteolyticus]
MKRKLAHYIVFSILSFMLLAGFAYASKPIHKEDYLEITVTPGDTLWKLANKYRKSHQLSTNEFIEWVIDVNHLSSQQIMAGEKLVIPVLKSKADDPLVVSK